jgi:dihydropteroate synthase
MYAQAVYSDVVREVHDELAARIAAAEAAGISRAQIAIDPGIGFAKTAKHSTAMLRGLDALRALGCPILVGISRKSFIGALAEAPEAGRRLPGSLAAALFAVSRGAAILRVHDVAETVQALLVWQALTA